MLDLSSQDRIAMQQLKCVVTFVMHVSFGACILLLEFSASVINVDCHGLMY